MTGTPEPSALFKAALAYERSLAKKRASIQQTMVKLQEHLDTLPADGESREWLRRLLHVQETVSKYWPSHWPLFEACLATYISLLLSRVTQGLGVVLVGDSGAGKGTILETFQDVKLTYWTDKFTPSALLSGFAEKTSKDQANERALFRLVKHRALVVGDLGPILSGSRDAQAAMYSLIPPWFDGKGLHFNFGTHGSIGMKGDFSFVLLGGKTPFSKHVWNTMASVGPRLLFLRVARMDERETIATARYDDAKIEIQTAVTDFLNWVFDRHSPRTLAGPHIPPDGEAALKKYAQLIALGQTLSGGYGEEIIRPTPNHLLQRMSILVRASALLWQRTSVNEHDLALARAFVRSSTPGNRGRVLLALSKGPKLTSELVTQVRLPQPTLYNTLIDLEKVGVVRRKNPLPWDPEKPNAKPGRPPDSWEIAPEPEDPEREVLRAESREES